MTLPAVPQRSGIEIFVPKEEATEEGLLEGVKPRVRIIRHNYQFHIFNEGDANFETFNALILKVRSGLRRNYESIYTKDNPQPATAYSLDGKTCSRQEEVRELGGRNRDGSPKEVKPHKIYGSCDSCYFNQFGTAEIWRDGKNASPGTQCKPYTLIFCLTDKPAGFAVVQIPATSADLVGQQIAGEIQRGSNISLWNVWWSFNSQGGGASKKGILIFPSAGASPQQVQDLRKFYNEYSGYMESFANRFAGGESIDNEELTGSGAEI